MVAPALDWKFLGAMLTALLGIPIYAFIAVALGVFGSNPLEQQPEPEGEAGLRLPLHDAVAGLYVYAIVTPQPAQRLIFMVLTLLLAFALWQKARDQLPYLLDPDASPPPRVSTSDGLIAAMVFFVAQAVAAAVIIGRGRVTGAAVLFAFSIGGAVTYALMRSVYAKAKTEGVPQISRQRRTGRCSASPRGLAAGGGGRRSIYSGSMRWTCSRAPCAPASRTPRSACGRCRWRSSPRRCSRSSFFAG